MLLCCLKAEAAIAFRKQQYQSQIPLDSRVRQSTSWGSQANPIGGSIPRPQCIHQGSFIIGCSSRQCMILVACGWHVCHPVCQLSFTTHLPHRHPRPQHRTMVTVISRIAQHRATAMRILCHHMQTKKTANSCSIPQPQSSHTMAQWKHI